MPDFLPYPDIQDVDLAFPAHVAHLIPLETKEMLVAEVSRKSKQLATDWFYHGLKKLDGNPKEGIDATQAFKHIRCILASFEPKHEVKMQAVAYLLDLWFDDLTWKAGDANR